MRLNARAKHRGLHGHGHIDKQRRTALIMVITGAVRTLGWLTLTVLYIAHVPFAVKAFASVSFVAVMSSLALAETAWSQVAGSLAQLTAGDAHHDAEATRRLVGSDLRQIDADVARLADLQPGPDAQRLADEIRGRLQ